MEPASDADVDVIKRIQKTRRELLDLSARNRLISTPRTTSRGRKVDIDDERSEEVFRLLVRERKAMSFVAGSGEADTDSGDDADILHLAQPEEDSTDGAPDSRHTDLHLQTRMTSEQLQARLLGMYYDAQTYEQEQGVSILYLAMGFLTWYESASSDKPRYAPLLLVPVDLDRRSAAGRFQLRHREEDVTTNLSLQAKLRAEFGVELPEVPEMEDVSPEAYFDEVARAVTDQPRWKVRRNDMIVWFFSFAKYLMYRDLDPGNWPAHSPLGANPTLSGLLGEGFVSEPALCGEGDKIDPLIPPAAMIHVTDADSSQAVVIEEVRRGRHLVVQGPPGTGKSQTITNLIATAVKEGKKVLFVAEKMVALDVVHDRLKRLGLADMCLALHSNKTNKKAVLEELARTLALGRPKLQEAAEQIEALQAAIGRLNEHADVMNTRMAPSGLTPYQVVGRLTSLYGRGVKATNLGLAGLESWSHIQFRERRREVEDFQAHLEAINTPGNHAWLGVTRTELILHAESSEFFDRLGEVVNSLEAICEFGAKLADSLSLPLSDEFRLEDARQLARFAKRLVGAPPMDRARIAARVWEERAPEIARLVEHGRQLAEKRYLEPYRRLECFHASLARVGSPSEHPCRGIRRAEPLSGEDWRESAAQLSEAVESLQALLEDSRRLEETLHLEARPDASLKEVQQLAQLALCILRAPRMHRCGIDNPIWDSRRDQIAELVKQGQAFSAARAELGDKVADVAWQADLSAARRHLAGYGGSVFRWFNRNYREAVATLRGVLKGAPPRALSERLRILDAVISAQATSRSLDQDSPLGQVGQDAFGNDWKGPQSDWGRLAEIMAWDGDCLAARLARSHRAILAGLDQAEYCRAPLTALPRSFNRSVERLKSLLGPLDFDCGQAFGVDSVYSIPVRTLVMRLCEWRDRTGALTDWIEYQACLRRLERVAMSATALAIHEGRITVEAALEELQSRFHQDLEPDLVSLRIGVAPEPETSARVRSLTEGAVVNDFARDAFGAQWKGVLSDWTALEAVVKWDQECRGANLVWNHRRHLSRLDSVDLRGALKALGVELNRISGELPVVFKSVEFDAVKVLGGPFTVIQARTLLARLRRWQSDPEGLSRWIQYQMRRRRLKDVGLAPLVDALHDGRIAPDAAVDLLQASYYQALIRDVFRRHAGLAEFDGQSHDQWIADFRALDQARIGAARGEVAAAHYDAMPQNVTGGEMTIVRRELEKRRRHKPIRLLIKEAGSAVLAIKPVFMMSPLSVAQYLEPGSVTFDLLLIDEASQVSPVDALGAMARARQVVVVGDDKQLPPTRFFSKMLDDGAESDDSDGLNAGDLESILGLCVAQGMSQRMLRWHYRSRHHSLIAVSNREFYDSRLYVVPSPTAITPMHGLQFRFIKDGVFDRGGKATNRVEARAIAEAVIEHAKRHPKKSLGVGAFSVSQRDAIRDELESLQREHAELSGFFSPGRPERFFVKNLEHIQGDERDVTFISVGYARDPLGYMAMNFGPLSSQGGERRLNVLISRARERCEVFSSITADDIDLERAKSRGAAAFKNFLRYAATGVLDTQAPTGGDFDSDFERQVARALEGHGYEVHCQIGTAGFIIDLAVVDPARPGRYLLGIECDGATYHSSRSARDRDRLREAVLRDRGWRIHRVWSTDWFHRPGEQLEKIVAAIEKAGLDSEMDEEAEAAHDDAPLAEAEIERAEPIEVLNGEACAAWVSPYAEAVLDVPSTTPIHETSLLVLTSIVARVVAIEGPIHRDEVARRITSLWGQERTGRRIAEAISKAIESGIGSGTLQADSDFVIHRQQAAVPVRCRANVVSPNLKKPEMIPPSEIRQAIHCLVSEHVGLRRDETPVMVAKALGFKAAGAKLKDAIENALMHMLGGEVLMLRDEKLFLP